MRHIKKKVPKLVTLQKSTSARNGKKRGAQKAIVALDRQHHQTVKKWRGKCLLKVPNFKFVLKFASNPQNSRKNGQIPKNWHDL